jgi:hypothetical protein
MKNARFLLSGLLLALLVAGCGDDPFDLRWEENPQESLLFSLDRDELNRPSAFSMAERRAVVVESSGAEGRWDFAVDRRDGALVLIPPRALGVTSRAGIVAIPDAQWDEVREAPRDTLVYETEAPVTAELGTIYVIRTHEQPDLFGRRCTFFGKLEAVELNAEEGTFRFIHDTSPQCNNRRLVPPGS